MNYSSCAGAPGQSQGELCHLFFFKHAKRWGLRYVLFCKNSGKVVVRVESKVSTNP